MTESDIQDLRVNYDQIAATYDRRYESNSLDELAEALRSLVTGHEARRILEVGCGTGRWLAALPGAGRRVFGLDLSPGMLHQARKRSAPVYLACGRAGQLPLPRGSLDLLYVVNALHHFEQKRRFLREARRLLAPGGLVAIVAFDPRRHPHWFVYQYFEGTYEMDLQRMPAATTLREWLSEAGFRDVRQRVMARVRNERRGAEIWDDPFLQKQGTSELALLSDEEYEAGLRRIRETIAAAEAAGTTSLFQAHIDFVLSTARAPA